MLPFYLTLFVLLHLFIITCKCNTILLSKKIYPGANIFPDNQLPEFVDLQTSFDNYPNDNCPDVFWENLIENNIQKLPYRICDSYDRSGAQNTNNITLPIIIYENNYLKVTIYPTLGGKIGSIIYKKQKNSLYNRELLFNNPVFQPGALGRINGWTSGGIEWNWPKLGHTVFTLKSLYVAIINTTKGDILRLYEFDREMNTTYSIDLYLPNTDEQLPALYAQITLTNTNENDIEGYWWTNIGVNISRESRVLYPADYSVHSKSNSGLYKVPFPFNNQWNNGTFNVMDHSYPINYYQARENFVWGNNNINNKNNVSMMSIVDKNGNGLIHGATIKGRKYWVWGNDRFDVNRMDFLSSRGNGNYLEMQSGIAPSQSQTFTLKKKSIKQFYEIFAPLSINSSIGNESNYTKAVYEAQKTLNSVVNTPHNNFEEIKQFLASYTNTIPSSILWYGSPWGYYHQTIVQNGSIFSNGLKFFNTSANMINNNNNFNKNNNNFSTINPWYELIKYGKFTNQTLTTLSSPLNYAIDIKWINLLKKSIMLYGSTWLHHLYLAIGSHSNSDIQNTIYHYQKSLEFKETVIAYRGLALLSTNISEIISLYNKSINIAINIWNLAGKPSLNPYININDDDSVLLKNIFSEYFSYLFKYNKWEYITNILNNNNNFPKDLLIYDQSCNIISIAMLIYSTDSNDINPKLAIQKLNNSHYSNSDYLASQLVNIWYDAWYLINSNTNNTNNLTIIQMRNTRVNNPPPLNIDFHGAT